MTQPHSGPYTEFRPRSLAIPSLEVKPTQKIHRCRHHRERSAPRIQKQIDPAQLSCEQDLNAVFNSVPVTNSKIYTTIVYEPRAIAESIRVLELKNGRSKDKHSEIMKTPSDGVRKDRPAKASGSGDLPSSSIFEEGFKALARPFWTATHLVASLVMNNNHPEEKQASKSFKKPPLCKNDSFQAVVGRVCGGLSQVA